MNGPKVAMDLKSAGVPSSTKLYTSLFKTVNFILRRIGSDEEDNDSDQEENKDCELETAVSRQESLLRHNESPISTESNSNGNEYVLVNRSPSDETVPENEQMDNS